MPVLQCKMFIDSKNEFFYDDPSDIDDPAVSWFLGKGEVHSTPQVAAAAVPTARLQGIVVTGDTVAQIPQPAISIIESKASTIGLVLRVDTLFIELCASVNFELTNQRNRRSYIILQCKNHPFHHESRSRKRCNKSSLGIYSLHLRLPMEARQQSVGSTNR